jgi:UDP-N-acetylmuramoyl-tripeptide--D-alanyl-D-alanine ligase
VSALALIAVVLAAAAAALRWLRVAQREHYLAGSASRFALRWWFGQSQNRLLAVAVLVGLIGAFGRPIGAVISAVALLIGPFGLSLFGKAPGPMAWTRRMRTLAAAYAALLAVAIGIGAAVGEIVIAGVVAAAFTPVLVDLACLVTKPLEDRLAERFVDDAKRRLASVHPTTVAITGSYGKTTTKGYVAHLLSGTKTVVASPRSFNNRAGLARAVNENLVPGTQVFVAEMGTYGPGEIAELCSWVKPRVGVITAIGPVHLERFGSEDRILEAKAEIVAGTELAILNVDDERLRKLADRLAADGRRVVRCSATDFTADVCTARDAVGAPSHAPPTNVACAVAVALALNVPHDEVLRRLPTLPVAPNRLTVTTGETGVTVLDDTFNSNPAGAKLALGQLRRHADDDHQRVVVTPGMIELGNLQDEANRAFAEAVVTYADRLVVVGYTNRPALVEGAKKRREAIVCVEDRDEAVAWVRQHLGPGDAVLYENDLPDHYP